jgi:nucleoside-diphosphate-sugar epimerase
VAKVLITGSSGFIGSYLVREFASNGHAVAGLDARAPGPAHAFIQGAVAAGVPLELGDLQSWSTIVAALERHRPEVLVHNASFVRPDILAREPLTAMSANLAPALMVMEAARLFAVRRLVLFSTIGVFPRAIRRPIDADHPVLMAREGTPDTFYGAAKIAAEAFAFAYFESFGLDVIIVRPSAVYGFGMNWAIYIKTMVEGALDGSPVRFATGGDMPRDYTHALDVAQLARLCAEVPVGMVRDRIFYGATGRETVTAGQAAAVVRELVPGADIKIGPGIDPEDVRDAATRGRFDITAAQAQLGYQPRFADLRAGVVEYIRMYRAFQAVQG